MTEKCKWPLGNGEYLEFEVVANTNNYSFNWKKVPGLYIFAFLLQGNTWYPLYVGQTDDFSSRLPSHERFLEAIQRGATHIHAVHIPQKIDRNRLEQMLIQRLQPQLNAHHR